MSLFSSRCGPPFSALFRPSMLAVALLALPMAASAAKEATPEQQVAAPEPAPSPKGWSWAIAPYLWATSVSTDVRDGSPPAGNDAAFNDIVSKIDMALQLHVEGQGDRFGAFGDVTYLSLSDDATHPNATSSSSLDVSMIELAGVWNVEPERLSGLDLFVGARYLGTQADIRIDPLNPALPSFEPDLDVGLTDLMVGARYSATLSDRWGATLRLDAAGGETEGAINASLLFRYRVGRGAWIVGYRHLDVELGEDDRKLDLTLSGPLLAFYFGF
ncbi:MAG: hypothetical protein KA196_00210 [Arenimonas sp.]|nr:hypothetical protein [Arenimonas sp.]